MPDNEKLKPCPFCGGKARLFVNDDFCDVSCTKCGVSTTTFFYNGYGIVDTKPAISTWNRRVGDENV